jgi:hypothetical protein
MGSFRADSWHRCVGWCPTYRFSGPAPHILDDVCPKLPDYVT